MFDEKLVRSIVCLFYWHPIVQEYFVGLICNPSSIEEKRSTIENWRIGLRYIREHGNSMWARIDYFTGKLRIIIFVIAVIIMIAMMVGWRHYFN